MILQIKRADGLASKSALTSLPMQINKKAESCQLILTIAQNLSNNLSLKDYLMLLSITPHWD